MPLEHQAVDTQARDHEHQERFQQLVPFDDRHQGKAQGQGEG